jgi:hypothetical protein
MWLLTVVFLAAARRRLTAALAPTCGDGGSVRLALNTVAVYSSSRNRPTSSWSE